MYKCLQKSCKWFARVQQVWNGPNDTSQLWQLRYILNEYTSYMYINTTQDINTSTPKVSNVAVSEDTNNIHTFYATSSKTTHIAINVRIIFIIRYVAISIVQHIALTKMLPNWCRVHATWQVSKTKMLNFATLISKANFNTAPQEAD